MMDGIRPSLCFVAHFAYGALAGGNGGHIGGVERQTSLMAKWLAARGHRVSLVTWDEGQKDGESIDGVQVFKLCRRNAGLPGLRFFRPRWSSLNAAMKRADADVYYHNCGEYVTGQVAMWCRRHGRKFVYSVASDPDCDVRLPEMHSLRERLLYRHGLNRADRVIVQTCKQQEMLREGFHRESVVIPMPCPGPSDAEYADCVRNRNDSQRVLWIGRVCEQKRPDRLLDLAEAHSDLSFDFVGPFADTQYARQVRQRATRLANVTIHGPATRERVSEFYRRARVMCCTSDFEGFPNTFLEAWSWGLPIVSTFDPDDLILRKGLGYVGTNIAELATGIRTLLSSKERWNAFSLAARRHYGGNHTMDKVMTQFERVFCEVARSTRSVSDGAPA